LERIELGGNKIKIIAPGTFRNLNQFTIVALEHNECIDKQFGCWGWNCKKKFYYTELNSDLLPCYENHKKSLDLLNEGENNFYELISGS
jgi:hypothetical protein